MWLLWNVNYIVFLLASNGVYDLSWAPHTSWEATAFLALLTLQSSMATNSNLPHSSKFLTHHLPQSLLSSFFPSPHIMKELGICSDLYWSHLCVLFLLSQWRKTTTTKTTEFFFFTWPGPNSLLFLKKKTKNKHLSHLIMDQTISSLIPPLSNTFDVSLIRDSLYLLLEFNKYKPSSILIFSDFNLTLSTLSWPKSFRQLDKFLPQILSL